MPIAIGNKRLPVTLDEKRQKELQQLKQKYGKSESRIMCIALDLLIACIGQYLYCIRGRKLYA
ncbi:TPA: hypothetical protein IXT04_002497 [Enterococcus faecium]|jgi:hypothetical protein|uniref:hypothetical protein n=1 Tax=Enterococcus faecium TaxID=1352 RepID=UPI000763BCF1|nr:hypothetical protein [Enterococcus faecium]KWY03387.1 hypothetical protein AS224_02490 [Enterococcus faecium]KWY67811.1 hypothetical protein AS246_04475 [Enterococcus faecium]MBG7805554.1 hypothetical protein [Enterococcus faecium]MBG7842070.1 hypothetical protein [Enterococcus faecium]MBG7955398.1 hypothetical protein [Enterococcus faecium]